MKRTKRRKKPFSRQLNHIQSIALGFFIIIMTGALLLCLPISSRNGEMTPFLDSLFTATSATCVTGLVVADTYQHFSLAGQMIILLMIQTGGLGFVTIGVWFSVFLKKKIGLRERGLIQESLNVSELAGVVRLVKKVVKGTLIFEGAGALILSLRFIPELGVGRGIWNGIFHSVSAFCNGGFDLMGRYEAYSSLTRFYDDPVVNLVVVILVLAGGIGFLVWDDITEHRLKIRSYRLHTKIVLVMTLILLVVPTILFLVLEWNHAMKGMGAGGRFFSALFSSVTPRTAGFNTIDTASLSNGSKVLTMVLMFVGGSPGSTAGGIKTTTLFVVIACIAASFRNKKEIHVFRRRLSDEVARKALLVFGINFILALTAGFFIFSVQPELSMDQVLFEVFSAIGTAGMSTGVTRELGTAARIAIIFLMYCGRVGSLSFALSLFKTKKTAKITYPVERITIG